MRLLGGMLLKPARLIGLEIEQDRLRAVEVALSRFGSQSRVSRQVELSLAAGDELHLLAALRQLRAHGFKAKELALAVSGATVQHHIVTLPPMKRSEMAVVLQRELRGEWLLAPEQLVYDFAEVGEVEEHGIRRREVLVAAAGLEEVRRLASAAAAAGFRPLTLTTIPIALANLMRLRAPVGEDAPVALLKIGQRLNTLVVLKRGVPRFSREFEIERREDSFDDIEYAARLNGEIDRSLLSYRQAARGEEVSKIILCGSQGLRALTGQLIERFGVEVEILNASTGGWIDAPNLPEDGLAQFALPIALTLGPGLGGAALNLNLIPREIARRSREKSVRAAGFAATTIALLVLAGAYFLLGRSISSSRAALEAVKAELGRVGPQLLDLEQVELERAAHQQRQALLRYAPRQGPKIAALLALLSQAVSDDMNFTRLEIGRKDGRWSLEIEGQVRAASHLLVQQSFNEFYQKLLASPLIAEAKLLQPVSIAPVGEAQPEPQLAAEQTGVRAAKMEFKISLVAK